MRHTQLACLLIVGFLLASCSVMGRSSDADQIAGIRTPQPTFTPTPIHEQASNPSGSEQSESSQPLDGSPSVVQTGPETIAIGGDTLASTPRVVVNSPLVNVRTGPGTTYDIIATVERGQEFEIVGRNAEGTWWFVCCHDNDYILLHNDLVDTDGPVDSVPITGGATETPSAIVTPEAPAPVPVAQFDMIRQEQFAESSLVRVFLYVTAESSGLPDYRARITKDGRELTVDAASFGGPPAFTWPFQDARQRHQNFKVEFPGESPAGVWEIQLLNADGVPVGPQARFTLTANDPQQELYVRYERR